MDRAEALRAIAERVAARREELARKVVLELRVNIVGYYLDEGEPEFDEAVLFMARNVEALFAEAISGEPVSGTLLEETRLMARRLTGRGVSLGAMQHSSRAWGVAVWEAVLEAARKDVPAEREAALEIGSRIWRHVDVLSIAAAHAYLDEVTDRGLLNRELMDALLAGRGDTEFAHRLARTLKLRLAGAYVAVLVRGDGVPVEDAVEAPLSTRVALDHIVESARRHLHPAAGSLLMGIRLGDVVALYPVERPEEVRDVRCGCEAIARALNIDLAIGMSGSHCGMASLPIAYEEAREAVKIAVGTGCRGHAVGLEDVLVDHLLRSSSHAQRILDAALEPLLAYDRHHHADLVATLRAYTASGTNLTQAARRLNVHPNTVVYRLQRIRQLSGRDPHALDELLVLFLALKLAELRASS